MDFTNFTNLFQNIPYDFIQFLLVAVFSLLIGLEQRRHLINLQEESVFGTDRTFTLLGIAGYILYLVNTNNLFPFITGAIIIGALLTVYYYQKMKVHQLFGMTSIVTALITYSLAPLIYTQPKWLVLVIVVCLLIITEIKESLMKVSKKLDSTEFLTLAKFLVLAGVILPVLSTAPISGAINISPFKIWLAIVAVSAISYLSYILKKFVFPDSGILLTGLLGGFYSSTATTVILARKSNEEIDGNRVLAAIFLAISMMYLRVFILAAIFNMDAALKLLPFLAALILIGLLTAAYFIVVKKKHGAIQTNEAGISTHKNHPLEFKTAFIFGALFFLFTIITGFIINHYGEQGAKLFSMIVGVTDINPFIITLLQGKWNLTSSVISVATLNAITSNITFIMIYSLVLSSKSIKRDLALGFGVLIIAGIVAAFI